MSFSGPSPRTAFRLDSPVEPRDVVIVGGGIAGIEALMALADLGDNRLRLQVIAAHPRFVLRPQILGEPWGGDPLHIDLERLCRAFGAQFTLGTVTAIDAAAHRVQLAAGPTVSYERLLLAPGAQLTLPYQSTRVLGFGALPNSLASAGPGSVAIVVPAGTSWTLPAYELALLCAGEGRDVRVVTAEAEPMEAFGSATVAATLAMLRDHGIEVERGGTPPIGSDLSDLSGLADTVVALPLLKGPAIGELPPAMDGFIAVDRHMAVRGLTDVHAAGDATDGPIKQGGLAAQQADTAATEIVNSCGGDAPSIAYEPVLRGKLSAPDGVELYLRRALDDADQGRTSDERLWEPPSIVCAWRLARWLSFRRDDLEEYTLDHVARPTVASA